MIRLWITAHDDGVFLWIANSSHKIGDDGTAVFENREPWLELGLEPKSRTSIKEIV